MRLSELERRALAHALGDIDHPVKIFGSRLDDAARGGDIDLIVLAPGLGADDRLRLSLRIAVAFRSFCDEKIDVHVLDPHGLTAAERAFLSVIRTEPLHPGGLVGTGLCTPAAAILGIVREHEP